MKRQLFQTLAISALMAFSLSFSSCQVDAPEITYTLNVNVNNDFTKVVEAINNGALKEEAAIGKLIEAIDKMNADQNDKLQALINVVTAMDNTLQTRLATIEAALKAQTLSLEEKLHLLEVAIQSLPDYSAQLAALQLAIENLPDYTSQFEALKTVIENLPDYAAQLDAISTAIAALPDYSDKFSAVIDGLGVIKEAIEALGNGQTEIAIQISAVSNAINEIIASMQGNTGVEDTLVEIIALLNELKEAVTNIDTTSFSFTNSVTVDDVTMPILAAHLKQSDYEDGYWNIDLLLTNESLPKRVNVRGYEERHGGKTIDLTKFEPLYTDIWNWSVTYWPERYWLISGCGNQAREVMQCGTLLITKISEEPEFEIILRNGRATDGKGSADGLVHTISLDFKGVLEFVDL